MVLPAATRHLAFGREKFSSGRDACGHLGTGTSSATFHGQRPSRWQCYSPSFMLFSASVRFLKPAYSRLSRHAIFDRLTYSRNGLALVPASQVEMKSESTAVVRHKTECSPLGRRNLNEA